MGLFFDGFQRAFQMIVSGDPQLFTVVLATLKVCFASTFISMLIGIPLGAFTGLKDFLGKKIFMVFVNVGMGLPPVVAGLLITMLLWRSGPLGSLHLLYTKQAIVMAQIIVAVPIVIGMTATAFEAIEGNMLLVIRSLGATRIQAVWLLIKEVRYALYTAFMAGLGRVFAEVGASMMVGGNLQGDTRILTTSIVMEVSKGNFDIAIALSIILLSIAFIITMFITFFQQKRPVA